jgi:uncharacterized Ntn-hydrolase superfamily protein
MNGKQVVAAMAYLLFFAGAMAAQDFDPNETNTFSIIGRDPATGELGMGVQSKAFAAGNRTITAKGGVAVVAHQSASNPLYGTLAIELIERGMTPQQALDMILRSDEGRDSRQVAVLDFQGRTAAWTSKTESPNWKGHKCGSNYCAQGNTLAGPAVVDDMARAFERTTGPLAERLLAGLDAAQAAGGDVRGVQAAAIVIVKPLAGPAGLTDRVIDIRVDDHKTPLPELRRILNMFRSGQMITEANGKLQAGDLNGALQTATAARDKSPENDNAHVALANVFLKMNRKADALNTLRKAVEINPALKRQLPRNTNFDSINKDPEFLRIVGS